MLEEYIPDQMCALPFQLVSVGEIPTDSDYLVAYLELRDTPTEDPLEQLPQMFFEIRDAAGFEIQVNTAQVRGLHYEIANAIAIWLQQSDPDTIITVVDFFHYERSPNTTDTQSSASTDVFAPSPDPAERFDVTAHHRDLDVAPPPS